MAARKVAILGGGKIGESLLAGLLTCDSAADKPVELQGGSASPLNCRRHRLAAVD